jgi:hypothetical protein
MWDNENISDELLAAFLDGNTTWEETEQVLEAMNTDSDLKEFAQIADDMISFEDKLDIWKGDYGYWELGIPPVLEPEEVWNEMHLPTIENDSFSMDDVAASVSFSEFDSGMDLGASNENDNSISGLDDSQTDSFDTNDMFNTDI